MSVKLDIYTDVKSALNTNVTDIKTVRLWNEQLPDNEEREKPIELPAVFIEYVDMTWDETTLKAGGIGAYGGQTQEQKGVFIVRLHCVFESLEQETDSFPAIDAIIDNIFKYINMLKGTYYTALKRVNEGQTINHDRLQDWTQDYVTGVQQCGFADDKEEISGGTVDPDIQGELDIDNVIIRTGDGEA